MKIYIHYRFETESVSLARCLPPSHSIFPLYRQICSLSHTLPLTFTCFLCR